VYCTVTYIRPTQCILSQIYVFYYYILFSLRLCSFKHYTSQFQLNTAEFIQVFKKYSTCLDANTLCIVYCILYCIVYCILYCIFIYTSIMIILVQDILLCLQYNIKNEINYVLCHNWLFILLFQMLATSFSLIFYKSS
jgi:hypothetical protein